MQTGKRILFISIVAILPVPVFLLLLEGGLRLAGYGYDTRPLVRTSIGGEPHWTSNPDFTRLYFPDSMKRMPAPDAFPMKKGAREKRLFIVGGSAVMGDPDPDFSIARNLEWILGQAAPQHAWNVVNLAYTACNSHVAREVVNQLARYEPDAVLVLVGNNEVIGPYGPATVLNAPVPSLQMRDIQVGLKKTKIGQLAQGLRESIGKKEGSESWTGMEAFLQQQFSRDAPELESMYSQYEDNLLDIHDMCARMGIPVILSNVPVNLLDQPPFSGPMDDTPSELRVAIRSYLESGTSTWPAEAWIAVAEANPESAYANWIAGRILWENGRRDVAEKFLSLARDLDQLRFRADSRLQAIIEELWHDPKGHWIPVDSIKALEQDHPSGALGFPHFLEHVHFSFRANFLIARAFAEALQESFEIDTGQLDSLQWHTAAQALGYTPFEVWKILENMKRRFERPPFTNLTGYGRMTAWMDALRTQLHEMISRADTKESITRTYLDALRVRPGDNRIRLKFARFLASFEKEEEAYQFLREQVHAYPHDSGFLHFWMELCDNLDKPEEAGLAQGKLREILPRSSEILD
ncbi:MAG: hypothetical protein AB3N64_14825 [Puniceicoccaceae bacterium]